MSVWDAQLSTCLEILLGVYLDHSLPYGEEKMIRSTTSAPLPAMYNLADKGTSLKMRRYLPVDRLLLWHPPNKTPTISQEKDFYYTHCTAPLAYVFIFGHNICATAQGPSGTYGPIYTRWGWGKWWVPSCHHVDPDIAFLMERWINFLWCPAQTFLLFY